MSDLTHVSRAEFKRLRFFLGFRLVAFGLRLMPRGASREELRCVLKSWGRHVKC